jgi:hypothetical protein
MLLKINIPSSTPSLGLIVRMDMEKYLFVIKTQQLMLSEGLTDKKH